MRDGQGWLCAVCGRRWVTGYAQGIHTAPECDHGAEVRLPVWPGDEADALRWIAEQQRQLLAGSSPARPTNEGDLAPGPRAHRRASGSP